MITLESILEALLDLFVVILYTPGNNKKSVSISFHIISTYFINVITGGESKVVW